MGRLRLQSRIFVISGSMLLLTSMLIIAFVATRALEHRQNSYALSIENLVFSTKQSISGAQKFDKSWLRSRIDILASSPQLKSVTLVDTQRRVIAHSGETHTPPINPANFPKSGAELLNLGQFAVFIESLTLTDAAGREQNIWLVVNADRTRFQSEKARVLRTAAIIMVLTAVVSVLLANLLARYVVRFIQSFENAILEINAGAADVDLSVFDHEDLVHLEEQLEDLASQMYKYRTDIREEIEQTTQDLRETLETIEIQNVELDIARKNAVQASTAKSEFLANMSHEIRTPLNGIIGFAKILMRSPLNAHQADTLRAIHKSSEILLMIINDILDFSKIEAGRVALEEEELNFYELIEDIAVMLAPSAHHKGLELNYIYYEDAPRTIFGDSLRLKQIITNLINNAIKFTEQGEIIIRVMLDDSLELNTDNLKIAISDTGIGLTNSEQAGIFKAFSQADASTARQFGGTGLGLSICKGLVAEMHGEINLSSEQGKGSTFWFAIPIKQALLERKHQKKPFTPALHCSIYEPHGTAQQSLCHLLAEMDLSYSVSKSLDKLVSSINGTQTGAAILSLSEQELRDERVINAILQLKQAPLPVLLCTPTLSDYNYQSLGLASGHLLKPATSLSLRHALESLLDNQNTLSTSDERKALPVFSSNQKVLAVDDNDMNLSLIKSLLSEMGLEVDLANSGKIAYELCHNNFYPLIFMDIQMPDMDGIESLNKIKQLSQYRNAGSIVALTAYALPSEKHEFSKQGFIDLITKPINEQSLADSIRRFMPSVECIVGSPKTEGPVKQQLLSAAESNEHQNNNDDIELSAFSWEESVHLCNGNEALAKEFSEKLFDSLPNVKEELTDLLAKQDIEGLSAAVHKLHGTTLLCGIPRLRDAALETEHQLKEKAEFKTVQSKTLKLIVEINQLISLANLEL